MSLYALTLIGFALVISAVPFSVALSSSVYRCIGWKEALKIALVFAVFHAVMAAVGWGVGYGVRGWLGSMAVPVALFIMLLMTLRYVADARRKEPAARTMGVENMRILLGFAIVTSINTLLLSISLGILYAGWLDFTGMVAALVFLLTRLGVVAGKRGWLNLGRTLEILAGLLLLLIAAVILLQYLNVF